MRGFDPAALLGLIEAERITQIFGLPMMYRAVLDHPSFADRDLASLRRAVYAMAPMPDQLIRRCIDGFGCDFALLFGQTEMSPVTTLFRPEHQLSHIGAVGTPITGVQVAIMGPDGILLPPGQQGEIVYRGPSTMAGYLHNEAATEAAFAHGWFHSGDVGAFGDDGVLWFADRYKDVIKTGGENVASIEVEKAVYAAEPRVAEAVVVGLPYERWSEAITAVVVPSPARHSTRRPCSARCVSGWTATRCPRRSSWWTSCPRRQRARSARTWSGTRTPRTTGADEATSAASGGSAAGAAPARCGRSARWPRRPGGPAPGPSAPAARSAAGTRRARAGAPLPPR